MPLMMSSFIAHDSMNLNAQCAEGGGCVGGGGGGEGVREIVMTVK